MYDIIVNNKPFFIFLGLLIIFLFFKRKDLTLQGKWPGMYILMYRTKLGLDKMDKWSKKYSKTYLWLAYLCVFIGLVGMVFVFLLMFWQLGFIVENELDTGGGLVLPIKTESGTLGGIPVFDPPFFEWIVAISILMIVHEFAHGVIAERFNVRIKSSGLAFFGSAIIVLFFILLAFSVGGSSFSDLDIISIVILIAIMLVPLMPGAFVEPDEKQLEKKPWWQQVAVLGAGSTSNFIFGFLFLGLLLFVANPLIDNTMEIGDLTFSGVMNESSLSNYDINNGTIVSFNGAFGSENILTELDNLTVNETYEMGILSGGIITNYSITTFPHTADSSRGMIGINNVGVDLVNKQEYEYLGIFPLQFQELMYWIAFLNIAIGLMNLLPIWITDGGQIFRVMAVKYLGKRRGFRLNNWISWVSFVLIVLTVWPSLLFELIAIF